MKNTTIFNLQNFDEQQGEIVLQHKLYGTQKIIGIIHIINDEEKLGVRIKDQEIFLWKDEIVEVEINEQTCSVYGEIMCIYLTKT